jgi:hypothetical protein
MVDIDAYADYTEEELNDPETLVLCKRCALDDYMHSVAEDRLKW